MPPHPETDPPPDPDALGLLVSRPAFATDAEARQFIRLVISILRRVGR